MTVYTRRVLHSDRAEVQRQIKSMSAQLQKGNQLDLGDKGKPVEALQRHLKAAGLFTGPVTGMFDEATQAAVTAFQKARKLPTTGAVNAATLKSIKEINLFVKKDAFATSAKLGQRGKDVASLERRLEKLGFRPGTVDGIYDKKLEDAVKRYRAADPQLSKKFGGVAGRGLWNELAKAVKNFEHAPYLRRDTSKPQAHKKLDAATQTAVAKQKGLELGDSGRAVKNLQVHLEKAGYELGAQNGKFNSRTEAALEQYQAKAGLEASGRLDGKTWKKLSAQYFAADSATSPAQRRGERSGAVKRSESMLKKLGYKVNADGVFDAATERAVKSFQKKHKIDTSGRVGGGTLKAIEKAVEQKSSGGPFFDKVLKIARGELGTREVGGTSNIQKYSKFFGRGAEPWCADFVSYCYTKAGRKVNDPWTVSMWANLQKNGTANRNNPKPGQIVMFDWNPNSGVPTEHTGLVEKVYKKGGKTYIQTIEGNSGGMVRRRTYPLSSSDIRGFGYFK